MQPENLTANFETGVNLLNLCRDQLKNSPLKYALSQIRQKRCTLKRGWIWHQQDISFSCLLKPLRLEMSAMSNELSSGSLETSGKQWDHIGQ